MQMAGFEDIERASQGGFPQRLAVGPGRDEARRRVGVCRSARGAGLQAVQTTVRFAVCFGARGELHQLNVDDAGGGDGELGVERVGVHAHVEEAFGDGWVFEDGSQGMVAGGAEGGEGAVFEDVDVDYICVGVVGDVDG